MSVSEVTAAQLEAIVQDSNIVVPPQGGPAAAPDGFHQALATAAGTANRPVVVHARVITLEVEFLPSC